MPQMGGNLIVRQAYRSDSYGNNVVLESDRKINGKTLKFRIAHMQDGSINHIKPGQTIRAGDIIGKVGSTGRSTGPHIHLEVLVGDKPIDPASFFGLPEVKGTTTNQSQNTQPTPAQPQPATTETQTTPTTVQADDSPVYINDNGQIITQSKIPGLIKEIENEGFGANEGYGSAFANYRLRKILDERLANDGFRPYSQQRNIPSVPAALDWRSGYQRLSQGSAQHGPGYSPPPPESTTELPDNSTADGDIMADLAALNGDNSQRLGYYFSPFLYGVPFGADDAIHRFFQPKGVYSQNIPYLFGY